MKREELFKLHQEMSTRALELMTRKNRDYAAVSPFDNFKVCEAFRLCSAEEGVLIRMSDKLSRIGSILKNGGAAVTEESVEDTLIDIMNYSVCIAGILKERRETK